MNYIVTFRIDCGEKKGVSVYPDVRIETKQIIADDDNTAYNQAAIFARGFVLGYIIPNPNTGQTKVTINGLTKGKDTVSLEDLTTTFLSGLEDSVQGIS